MSLKRKNPNFWIDINSFPIFRILIGTIIGILIEYFLHLGIVVGIIGFLLCLVLLIILYFNNKLAHRHAFNFLNGFSYYSLWIFFGMFLVEFQADKRPKLDSENQYIKYGIVTQPTEEKAKSFKVQMEVTDSSNNQKFNVVAYFEKNDDIPQCGDFVGFFSDIRYLEHSKNPLEFDYAKYMSLQGVYCTSYVKKDEYKILIPGYKKTLRYLGSWLRQKLIKIYRSQGFTQKQLSVLEALTLGYKNDLDDETISAFQASGSMHILAVSGLHTGIIMMIVSWLLKSWDYTKRGRIAKFAVILIVLWAFAAITGFSSSVCRSALMFSLISFGNVMNRRLSTYTTLATSCFILLVINPLYLFNVGFLLSYFAVLSIVAVMPLMENLLFELNYKHDSKLILILKQIANYFIGIILVSIAAQVGTTVLSINTFHQFPMYFMLTNIIVIPLSFLIMISSVVMLAFNWIPGVCMLLSYCLKFFLDLLLNSVSWIEALPGSCVKGIYLTNISSILLYIFVFALVVFLIYNKINSLKFALFILLLFVVSDFYFGLAKQKSDSFIVFDKKYESYININKPDCCKLLTSKQDSDYKFLRLANEVALLKKYDSVAVKNLNDSTTFNDLCFQIGDSKLLVINDLDKYLFLKDNNFEADFVVISNNIEVDCDDLLAFFKPKTIIFDSSNYQDYISKLSQKLQSQNIVIHDVTKDGAFVYGFGMNPIWYY